MPAYSLGDNLQKLQKSPDKQRRLSNKAQIVQVLELTYVATHMVPPVVLHCLNILTLGQYSLAGWCSAHQLIMTILSYLSPYIPLTRYQQYAIRLPFNVVIMLLFWKLVGFDELTLTRQSALVGAAVGVASTLLWVGVPKLLSCKQTRRRPWNPYSRHEGSTAQVLIAVRLINSSLLTAVFEELYDRSFLYRVFLNLLSGWRWPSFAALPLRVFDLIALAASIFCFGAGHTRFVFEPVLGMIFAIFMHGLVFCFGSLGPAVVAHILCNLLLGVYVICSEDWMFW